MSRSSERRGGALRRFGRETAGQSVVELALVAPVLLVLILGAVELARALEVRHALSGISREGANIAARGTGLDSVLAVVLESGGDVGLRARGGAIATRVLVDDGVPTVEQQVASNGYGGKSRVGQPDGPAIALQDVDLRDGQVLYAVELFYEHRPITPLRALSGILLPPTVYERAFF